MQHVRHSVCPPKQHLPHTPVVPCVPSPDRRRRCLCLRCSPFHPPSCAYPRRHPPTPRTSHLPHASVVPCRPYTHALALAAISLHPACPHVSRTAHPPFATCPPPLTHTSLHPSTPHPAHTISPCIHRPMQTLATRIGRGFAPQLGDPQETVAVITVVGWWDTRLRAVTIFFRASLGHSSVWYSHVLARVPSGEKSARHPHRC